MIREKGHNALVLFYFNGPNFTMLEPGRWNFASSRGFLKEWKGKFKAFFAVALFLAVISRLLGEFRFTALNQPIPPPASLAMTNLRPQFLLFGDSITQRGFAEGGWGAAVADAYVRRVDVINRGYSGYNSRWAVLLLDHILPPEATGQVKLATVFFGANDAARPDRTSAKQHVPVKEYITNMRTIVAHLRSRAVPAILLLTPPPIHEPGRLKYVFDSFGVTLPASERTNHFTGRYADAAVALGAELGLPVVDLWRAFQEQPGWETALLNDGLHLTPAGNALVAKLVLEAVKAGFEGLSPEAMRFDVPEWAEMAEIDADPAAVLKAHLAANH